VVKYGQVLSLKVSRPVVLNLGSIEPQGFSESVSGFRRRPDEWLVLCVNRMCTYVSNKWFLWLRRFQWTHGSNLRGSVPSTRLRTTGPDQGRS